MRYTLADGSVCEIEPIDWRSSLVRRLVDGQPVWSQAFAKDTADRHSEQIGLIVAEMKARPAAYRRWYITSPQDPDAGG